MSDNQWRLVWAIVAVYLFLVVFFALMAGFSADFRLNGPTIVGVIFGGLTTFAGSVLTIVLAVKRGNGKNGE